MDTNARLSGLQPISVSYQHCQMNLWRNTWVPYIIRESKRADRLRLSSLRSVHFSLQDDKFCVLREEQTVYIAGHRAKVWLSSLQMESSFSLNTVMRRMLPTCQVHQMSLFRLLWKQNMKSKIRVVRPSCILSPLVADYFAVSFNLSLTSRLPGRALQNVVVELNLGEGATGIKCITSRETGMRRGMDVPGSSGASWAFDSRKKVCLRHCWLIPLLLFSKDLKWEITEILPSSSWNIRGSYFTAYVSLHCRSKVNLVELSCPPKSTTIPRPSRAVQVRFEIHGRTFSSLKVDQLKVTGENYKPYKGFRGRSTGNVEWRWWSRSA